MPYIFENYTQMWTFWHKDWIHMCTRSQNTQYSLNKFKFFTNKKKIFANYFLILRPGLLNKISIFFISRVIKFLKIWVPNRPKIEILFTKLVLRNKKCLMKKNICLWKSGIYLVKIGYFLNGYTYEFNFYAKMLRQECSFQKYKPFLRAMRFVTFHQFVHSGKCIIPFFILY